MAIVKHKIRDHQINPLTESLIIGTFNPDADGNVADFFYGRPHNFLWRLLPTAFGEKDLKGNNVREKLQFISTVRVDFIDLISEVRLDPGQEANYSDNYIDSKVNQWTNVIGEIDKLERIQRVCFTRKTFSGIPKMQERILEVEVYCRKRNLAFEYLKTPARVYSLEKQNMWTNFFTNDQRHTN